ncbi:MAG: alpha/beta hydrolase fold domain-containing protein [Planctomycetes bacterium]|nr:alpha/beta hydrolase fold domain-containing protein [Planctomycetota bacterium]
MKNLLWLVLAALLVPAFVLAPAAAQDKKSGIEFPAQNAKATAPDKQPEKGPGSSDYAHKKVEVYDALTGGEHYWLYTPAEPTPKNAPVVVFVHGYGALEPKSYDAWLEHLCKRGNIVIYPQYQAHGLEPPQNYTTNCATSILDAFKYLEADEKRVQPIKEDFAIAGHSAGGVTTANLAADWETLKLPKPKVAMPVQPGRAFSCDCKVQKNGLIPLSDFSNIPEDCLLLSIFSDSDTTVGSWCAKEFFVKATKVKPENKNLVEFISSEYAKTPAICGHREPAAPLTEESMIDVWDWYGFWKLLDGLTDAAFHGKNREYALGDTPEQKFMGKYSDGRPFEQPKVWKGDAEVNPDEEYQPLYDRNGKRTEAKPEKKQPAEPKKDEPSKEKGKKEDEEEF